jgi:hypothetical protein
MDSEQQNFSSAEMPEGLPPQQQGSPGQGQSKSSRRRRRKRNKTKPGAVAGAQQPGEQGEGGVATIQATSNDAQGANGNGAANSSANGGATKRWKKKKFRTGGSGGGNPNPGNQMSSSNGGGGGGRQQQRRGKQKGPRSFVGPMDHSYRDSIGNYADTPPSTIEIHGNHGSNGHRNHSRNHNGDDGQRNFNLGSREVAPQVSEDAATKIYCFVDDLFFLAKIQETARKLGVKVAFVKNDPESLPTLTEASESDHPALIVFDLNNANAKPMTLIPKLKTKFKKTASIVGFLSHLQGDLKAKAVEAGCDSVMPRSAFSQNLPNLLRRYGIEDVEEDNFNN